MGRNPCCSKEGLNRGAWTSHEDKLLTDYIQLHGQGRWRELPKKAGLKRCGKSCRLRWLNYLRPDIKRGNISPDEEQLIIKLHKLLGNRWSLIAGRLPGRTDNEIKNYWNTNLGKRVEGCSTTNSGTSRMKKHMTESSNEAETSSKVQVIRTKAYRCTKVFLTPLPKKIESDVSKNNQVKQPRQEVDTKSYQERHYCSPSEDDYKPSFVMDLNMGDFGLSDLLGSEFPQLSYFDKGNIENSTSNDLSISSNTTMLFNSKSLDDWRESECSSGLNSLSFLDQEEGWFCE
ncbi:hypothetical protein ACHQM5_001686 [Ranunculus cassubicifolius]